MSHVISGYTYVAGNYYYFSESVPYDDYVFSVVGQRLAELEPLLSRADRRVIHEYDQITMGRNVDVMCDRGVHLALPSGIRVSATAERAA